MRYLVTVVTVETGKQAAIVLDAVDRTDALNQAIDGGFAVEAIEPYASPTECIVLEKTISLDDGN